MNKDTLKAILFAIFLAAVVAIVVVSTRKAQDENELWHQLREAHHCQPVHQDNPPAGIGTAPGKTVWACDYGELIVRDSEQ